MKKSLVPIVILCLGLILFFDISTGYCASADEKANKLFVEAYQLLKSAQEADKTSYSDAFRLYKEALVKFERIISKYPSSQLAVKLITDEALDKNSLFEIE